MKSKENSVGLLSAKEIKTLKGFKKSIDAPVLSLAEIGWTKSKDDEQSFKYLKRFLLNNYDWKIDDEQAFNFICIIDDLMSEENKKFVWRCLQYKKYVFNNRYLNDILLEFKRDYPEAYIDYVKSNKSFPYWLFDFVMNGNMDGEKK